MDKYNNIEVNNFDNNDGKDKEETRYLVESIINGVFEELIFDNKKKFIFLDEFKLIFNGSNLDKTCYIDFTKE
jgi:hypothetical protein